MSLERKAEIFREGEVGSKRWFYRVNNYDKSGEGEEYIFQEKFGVQLAVIHGKGLLEHYILRQWSFYGHRDNYEGSVLNAKLADKIIRQKTYEYALNHTKNPADIIDMTKDKKEIRQDVEKRKRKISEILVFSP